MFSGRFFSFYEQDGELRVDTCFSQVHGFEALGVKRIVSQLRFRLMVLGCKMGQVCFALDLCIEPKA